MNGITVSRGHVDFFSLAERCLFTAEFFVALKVRLRGALPEVQIIELYVLILRVTSGNGNKFSMQIKHS